MVDPVKIFLTSSLINMQNFIVVCHTVCALVTKFGGREARPLGMGRGRP